MMNKKKLILSLIALFAANILLILVIKTIPDAQAATYRLGSQGDVVSQIQTKLKNWGYYDGNIDGDYGPKTTESIRLFQRRNGLTIDGAASTRTLQALGIYLPAVNANTTQKNNDVELLARLISAEADDEPYNGQVAVGAVVLNRVRHPAFPNTIAGVVYQPGAFFSTDDGSFDDKVNESSRRAALDAINGIDPSFGSIYYYNPKTSGNQRVRSRTVVADIGSHRFCK